MDRPRVSTIPEVMGVVPCVSGTRIPVVTIVSLVAAGMSNAEIIRGYPVITTPDIRACVAYAARAVEDRELPVRLTA